MASRKFCDLCQTELRGKDWAPKIGAAAVVLILTAFVSSFFQPVQPAKPAAEQQVARLPTPGRAAEIGNLNATPAGQLQSQNGISSNTQTKALLSQQKPGVSVTTEPVYYCGAATRKGTPCSRKVKHAGERCWQHKGMPSMLNGGAAIK